MLVQAVVSGIVQGVGFRFTAKQQAEKYNLKGWVKNQDDGTVKLEIQGKENEINQFLEDIKKGFNHIMRVDDIHVTELPKQTAYREFMIK